MSIATEISRLQTAKADLKSAIEGKGVTVPAAATLDDYADLVDAISGGANLQTKSIRVTDNGDYVVTPDAGYDGMDEVDIAVAIPIPTNTAEYQSGSVEIESTYSSTDPIAILHGLSSAPKYYACWTDDVSNSERHYQCTVYCADVVLRRSNANGYFGAVVLTGLNSASSSMQSFPTSGLMPTATTIYVKIGAAANIIPAGTQIYWEAVTW